jgi:hypothetical protein
LAARRFCWSRWGLLTTTPIFVELDLMKRNIRCVCVCVCVFFFPVWLMLATFCGIFVGEVGYEVKDLKGTWEWRNLKNELRQVC